MKSEEPSACPKMPLVLLELDCHERWLAGLSRTVKVQVLPDRLRVVVPRSPRWLGTGRDEQLDYEWATVCCTDAGELQFSSAPAGAPPRVLHGRDTACIQALLDLLDLLDPTSRGFVVGLGGALLDRFGKHTPGTFLVVAHRLLFVSTGRSLGRGRLLATFDASDLDRVQQTPTSTRVWTRGTRHPVLSISRRSSSTKGFVHWWSSILQSANGDAEDDLPVLWQDPGGMVSPARVQLLEGGIRLRSSAGPSRSLQSAGVHLEATRPARVRGGAVYLGLHEDGRRHRLWLDGTRSHAQSLRAHLRRYAQTTWRTGFHPERWQSCIGSPATLRVGEPGLPPVVVRNAVLEACPSGLVCEVPEPRVAELVALAGRHLDVELQQGRKKFRFRAVHQGISTLTPDVLPTEDEPLLDTMAAQWRLLPLGNGPEVCAGRRAQLRLAVGEHVLASVVLQPGGPMLAACVEDLSVEGARLAIPDLELVPESRLQLLLQASSGVQFTLQCEVVHQQRRSARVGLRFVGIDETVRTGLQRELLRLQRLQKNRAVFGYGQGEVA